ncbi:hypothetical protein J1N35_023960 [Gossypium stocksii]|uniref:Uncharacterized protein n=1 Tax=Gossypium stocksii TaxID=47602 RepID=A0A9D3VL84_9ROSI|nr:hypothetical protein J1N35_023960 [Gossypium stocksii]
MEASQLSILNLKERERSRNLHAATSLLKNRQDKNKPDMGKAFDHVSFVLRDGNENEHVDSWNKFAKAVGIAT